MGEQKEEKNEKVECFRCRKVGHKARDCKEVECYSCGQKGHIKRECNTKKGGLRWEREKVSKEEKKMTVEQKVGMGSSNSKMERRNGEE